MQERPPSLPIAIVVSVALCHGVAAKAPGDEIDRRCLAELTENGPPSWKKVASFVENIGVTCKQRRVDHQQEGSKTVSTAIHADWSLCWNRQSSSRLLERRDLERELWNLYIVNPKYRFNLFKLHEGDSFQLESGKRFAPGRPQSYDLTEEQWKIRLEAGIRAQGIPLEDLLAGKEFRLTRVQYVPDSNAADKRVLIECQYLGSEGRGRRAGGTYWAELKPRNSWMVHRSGLRIPANGTEAVREVTYQQTDALVPFPETVSDSSSIPRAKLKLESVDTFGKPTTCQRADQEFYLPYYGIPESALGYPGTSLWPRLLAYGAGIFGLGLVGVYARSRLRRKHTEK